MRTEIKTAAVLAVAVLLPGCDQDLASTPVPGAPFGEANRQTMMAQVVDPAPYYEDLVPPTSGEHAAQAVDRYRSDQVKQPESVNTETGSGSGGS